MFILNKEKQSNAINLLVPKGIREFTFINELTKKKIVKSFEGVKNGDYTMFIINATDIPQGSYMVKVEDYLATRCVNIGVRTDVNQKYQ